jgi:hypothetical protein
MEEFGFVTSILENGPRDWMNRRATAPLLSGWHGGELEFEPGGRQSIGSKWLFGLGWLVIGARRRNVLVSTY